MPGSWYSAMSTYAVSLGRRSLISSTSIHRNFAERLGASPVRARARTIDQAVQAGQLSASEAAAWWAGLKRAAEAERFFSAVLGFIAAGRKAQATGRP